VRRSQVPKYLVLLQCTVRQQATICRPTLLVLVLVRVVQRKRRLATASMMGK
jgi:hypothetical protein